MTNPLHARARYRIEFGSINTIPKSFFVRRFLIDDVECTNAHYLHSDGQWYSGTMRIDESDDITFPGLFSSEDAAQQVFDTWRLRYLGIAS